MEDDQKLFAYISYFENATPEEVCQWGGGNGEMPYPNYDEQLTDFIKSVYQTDLMDPDYHDTLEEYGVSMSEGLSGAIDTVDLKLTKAILTSYVRGERVSAGLWATAVKEKKVFYNILIRLRELEG